jgi:DNA-binding MarR family transcriptional regulator
MVDDHQGPANRSGDERARLVEAILNRNHSMRRFLHCGLHQDWLQVDVTMPQLKVLLILYGTDHLSMGELADALGVGVSTLTGIVDRLVDHGLVLREEDPHDRRVVVGRLTPRGVDLVDRLIIATRDRITTVLAELSLDDLRLIASAFDVLDQAIRRVAAKGTALMSARPVSSIKE